MSGWEPVEVTEYEYDGDRLVGSVVRREPEWCRADVEALLAHIESGRVGPHGQPMDEATSPLADPANPNRQWTYKVRPWVDFAARAEERAMRAYREQYGDQMDGVRFVTERVDL